MNLQIIQQILGIILFFLFGILLMLNVPQKPLKNINLYEENLNKVYGNGDVRVYEIGKSS